MRCDKKNEDQVCNGPIKPDITFFGESLPEKFGKIWENLQKTKDCDLLIIIGTALAVSPFNNFVSAISDDVPKVLVNMQNTGPSYDFDNKKDFPNRLYLQGKCDETLSEIAKAVGWDAELQSLIENSIISHEKALQKAKADELTRDL